MREIRLSGSEGGETDNPSSLPLSWRDWVRCLRNNGYAPAGRVPKRRSALTRGGDILSIIVRGQRGRRGC